MKLGSIMGFVVWGTVLGLMGFFFYSLNEARQEERRLREGLARFMEVERRARFLVRDVEELPGGGKRYVLWWEETRPDGPLPVREIVVEGEEIYFDTVQITFDPRFVKDDDPLRGRSLTLFRRIYGLQESEPGKLEGRVVRLDLPDAVARALEEGSGPVDGVRQVPDYYKGAVSDREELEAGLWSEIWSLFTDPRAAEAAGVRTAQRKSVGKPLVEGKEYRLTLSRTGQLDIEGPVDPDPMLRHEIDG